MSSSPIAIRRIRSSRRFARPAARATALLAALVLAACSGDDPTAAPPTGPMPGPPPDTTASRGALTLQVRIDVPDRPIAAALGLDPQHPAGLTVRLRPADGRAVEVRTATVDTDGRVRFTDVPVGGYAVTIERPLSATDRAALPADDQDVRALLAYTGLTVRGGENGRTLTTIASRPGGLIISEIGPAALPENATASTFLELYNNGDETVYLDGMLIGAVSGFGSEFTEFEPSVCDVYAPLRLNADALGVHTLFQFPGSGRQYPVAPGERVVIAEDATDDRPRGPTGLDLREAAFETVYGDWDRDNARVPNLRVLAGRQSALRTGYDFGRDLPGLLVLADCPAAPLPTGRLSTLEFADPVPFIPRALVRDVAGFESDADVAARAASVGAPPRARCDPWIQPVWERSPAAVVEGQKFLRRGALVREVAFVGDNGRVILQRTRSSARDWRYGPPVTPGR